MIRPYVFISDRSAMRHMAGGLVDALAKYCEPTLVCATPLGKYVLSGARVIEIDFPEHKYQPSFFAKMARLVVRLRKEKPDVIHCVDHNPAITPFQPFMRFCPLVQVWHDIEPHPGDHHKLFYLNRRICLGLADAVLVHGEKLKKDLLDALPNLKGKVYTIPHGTDSFFVNSRPDGNHIAETDNVLLFGRLVAYKGIDVFLKAAKMIHERMPHVTFTIAGKGDMTPYKDLVAEASGYVVVDNRTVPDEVVPELFKRAKVISLPYIEGSASGVLAIAHSFGKPSVATSVGSIGESMEDGITDLIVPPGDPAALAEATMRLLADDELRHKLGEGIRRKVEQELSYDRVAERVVGIYQELIEKRKASR